MSEVITPHQAQLKKKVGKVTQMNKAMDRFQQTNPKREFLEKYGVELQMTAAYTFTALFYRQDTDYLITINRIISPKDVSYYDFDKIAKDDNQEDPLIKKKKLEQNKSLVMKIYQFVGGKYRLVNTRICDPTYKNKICLSEDGTKMAIVRKSAQIGGALARSMFKKDQEQEIDVFDCSKVQFFLKKEPLTHKDTDLFLTIKDTNLHNSKKMEETFMRFSNHSNYLYMIFGRTSILAYKLDSNDKKEISEATINTVIPSMYETIINFAVNEKNISQSLFACKKKDFRNIDIFTLEFVDDLNDLAEGDLVEQKLFVKESNSSNYQKGSIRFNDLDISQLKLKFSHDLTEVVFSNKEQNLILTLAQGKEGPVQRAMHHLEGQHSIQITKDGDKDFIIATAKPQDSEITLRYSNDTTHKLTFPIGYVDGHCQIRDIYTHDEKIRLLITRDDEEFFIYEFDSNYKQSFWQKFNETSNYSFDWPYICYQEGQDQIVVLNAFDPKKVTIIDMAAYLPEFAYITDLQLTTSLNLYILVSTQDKYLLYQKDLDKVMGLVINTSDYLGNQRRATMIKRTSTQRTSQAVDDTKPVNVINKKDMANGVQPYCMHVRDSSSKEQIQLNLERLVFFVCDYKLYAMTPNGKLQYVDTCKMIKKIDDNLLAYTQRNANGEQSNQVRYLKIGYSEFSTAKAVEEFGGKLLSFHVSQSQAFLLVQQGDKTLLKIYDINAQLQSKFKISHELKNNREFIGTFMNSESMVNSCIPTANNLYNIVVAGKKVKLHHYNNVLPLQNVGDQVSFKSPKIDRAYRKMVYFVYNKNNQNPKTAFILPYLTDHFVTFNIRENITSFCSFSSKTNYKTQKPQHDIVSLIPYSGYLFRYALNGQMLQRVNLDSLYQKYGEKIVATSPNGSLYLQTFEDYTDMRQITIVKIDTVHPPQPKDLKTANAQEALLSLQKKESSIQKFSNQLDIKVMEEIDFHQVKMPHQMYQDVHLNTLGDVIEYLEQHQCKPVYKINDNLDIAVAFLYENLAHKTQVPTKYIKEMFILKKINTQREVFCVRINTEVGQKIVKMNQQETKTDFTDLSTRLLSYQGQQPNEMDKRASLFWALQELQDCRDFCLSNDHLILWSKERVFYNVLGIHNSTTSTISVKQSKFQIDEHEESQITQIVSKQMNDDDKKEGNCYINIKINVENKYAVIMKYNLYKEKEFASFDCNLESEIFYDRNYKSFILDKTTIIDTNQGVPLYFFKTGVQDINKRYLIGENIVSGSRFCKENTHFMVKNKVHIPFSYFTFVMIENNTGKEMNEQMYDPEAFFCINGSTSLHTFADSYKNLRFMLEQYEKTHPHIINLLLLKNSDGKNVLELAVDKQSSRCVNLILSKLGTISMNNIHQVKSLFSKLLDYSSFEQYLGLCYFQSEQMKHKTVMSCKKTVNSNIYLASHSTCFVDKEFNQNFNDESIPMRPVIIKAIDAGWILKSEDGKKFIGALSNSNNMNYFQQESIRLLVNYQWKYFKSTIIKYLFVPFIVNMVLFNIYAVIVFDNYRSNPHDIIFQWANWILQIVLLLFTFQTMFNEVRQIIFHKMDYMSSVWNLFDLMTVVLTPCIVIMDIVNIPDSLVRPLMSMCLLFFYLRLFYFLRIFDATAHLVRTILEISQDIMYFLMVLLIAIIGFGGSFLVLSNNNEDKDEENKFHIAGFADSILYSYKLILGEFDIDKFNDASNPLLLWTLFVISTLFTMIILLNMLIAIMGDSFNRVNEQSENQRVREHLQLIVENDFLVNRERTFKDVKYLVAIKDDNEDAEQDQVSERLVALKRGFSKKFKDIHSHIKTLVDAGVHHNKQFQFVKSELNEIKELMKKQGDVIESYASGDRDERSSTGFRQIFSNTAVGFQFNRTLNTE